MRWCVSSSYVDMEATVLIVYCRPVSLDKHLFLYIHTELVYCMYRLILLASLSHDVLCMFLAQASFTREA